MSLRRRWLRLRGSPQLSLSCGLLRVCRIHAKPVRALLVCQNSSASDKGFLPFSSRPFLCAPYYANQYGELHPSSGIDCCPWGQEASECEIRHHAWRPRKTGPGFPLEVAFCQRHLRYFTVYPPGHVPYGRQLVALVDPAGHEVISCEEDRGWSKTLFCRGSGCGSRPAVAEGSPGRRVLRASLCHPAAMDRT